MVNHLQHQKEVVSIFTLVPDKFAKNLDHHNVVAVVAPTSGDQ